jgi:hypothetical protein
MYNLTHTYAANPEKKAELIQLWKQQARERPNAPNWWTWSAYQPAVQAWLEGDAATALTVVKSVQPPAGAPAGFQNVVTMARADLLLMLGRLRDAEAVAATVQDAERVPIRVRSIAAFLRGDNEGAARALRQVPVQTRHGSSHAFKIWMSPRVGMGQEALALAPPAQRGAARVVGYPMYAEAAVLTGGDRRFLAPIETFLREGDGGHAAALRLSVTFADALMSSPKVRDACDILESQTSRPYAVWMPTDTPGGVWWIVARDALARCLLAAGRPDDARQVDEELAAMLATADDDVRIAAAVKSRLRSASR